MRAMASLLYQHLDSQRQEIRLLQIDPSLDFLASIKCRLFTASLAEVPPPSYKALSYVWGDPKVTAEIFINGVGRQVTINLVSALHRIRSKTDTIILWADAICINQDDLQERSKQVGMMALIYRTAELVLVWLGEESDNSQLAFDTLECWARWAENKTVGMEEKDLLILESDIAFVFEPNRILALQELSERSYWTRVWVVQELVLAKTAHVFCGPSRLTIDRFVLAGWAWTQLMGSYLRKRADEAENARDLIRLLVTNMHNMILYYCQYCWTALPKVYMPSTLPANAGCCESSPVSAMVIVCPCPLYCWCSVAPGFGWILTSNTKRARSLRKTILPTPSMDRTASIDAKASR